MVHLKGAGGQFGGEEGRGHPRPEPPLNPHNPDLQRRMLRVRVARPPDKDAPSPSSPPTCAECKAGRSRNSTAGNRQVGCGRGTHSMGALADVRTAGGDRSEAGRPPRLSEVHAGWQGSWAAGGQTPLRTTFPQIRTRPGSRPSPLTTPCRRPAAPQVWRVQAVGQGTEGRGQLAPEERTPPAGVAPQTPPR